MLYTAGERLNSGQAATNLRGVWIISLVGKHKIELVDVFKEPGRAVEEQIFITTTLVKLPPSTDGIVENLGQTELVLQALVLRGRIT